MIDTIHNLVVFFLKLMTPIDFVQLPNKQLVLFQIGVINWNINIV